MTKRFLAVCLVVLAMVSLAACSSNDECEICEETGRLTTVDVLGEELNLCRDCADEMEELNDMLRDLLD